MCGRNNSLEVSQFIKGDIIILRIKKSKTIYKVSPNKQTSIHTEISMGIALIPKLLFLIRDITLLLISIKN